MFTFSQSVEDMFVAITYAEYGIEAPVFGHEDYLVLRTRGEAFTG